MSSSLWTTEANHGLITYGSVIFPIIASFCFFVDDFFQKNANKNLTQDLKKRLEASNAEVEETQKQLDYMISMRQWLIDNFPEGKYRDVVGLCKAASIEEIREQDYSLNPGRYVGVSFDIDDPNDFREAMKALNEELLHLNSQSQIIMKTIQENLRELDL